MPSPLHRQRMTARRRSSAMRLLCLGASAWFGLVVSRQAAGELGFAGLLQRPVVREVAGEALTLTQTRGGVARAALEGLDAAHVVAGGVADAVVGQTHSSILPGFGDQGNNINGILFQASLPFYLIFLKMIGYEGNGTPPLVQFAFSFLLTFVLMTIPSGIISKSTYGLILADSDWLHGTAESLLTATNIMLVLGFRSALVGDKELADSQVVRGIAAGWLAVVAFTVFAGVPLFDFGGHAPFLGGIGGLWGSIVEPINALSLPNWIVHFSSVFEWLLAMSFAWQYAKVTGNERWKGLAWGMLPSHISSCAAVTFHVFYNQLPWVLTTQALFTFIGNATLALSATRLAMSNGFDLQQLNPVPAIGQAFASLTGGGSGEAQRSQADASFDWASLSPFADGELLDGPTLAAEVVALSLACAYGMKYGELFFPIFQSTGLAANFAAALCITVPPVLVAGTMYLASEDLQQGRWPSFIVECDETKRKEKA